MASPHLCEEEDKLTFTRCYFALQQQPKLYFIAHFKIVGLLFPYSSLWKIWAKHKLLEIIPI